MVQSYEARICRSPLSAIHPPNENDYISNQICKTQNTGTMISDTEYVDDARARRVTYMLLFSKSAQTTSF